MKKHKVTIMSTLLLSGLLLVGCGTNQASSEHHSKHTQTEKVKKHHKHDADKQKKHDDKNKHHDKKDNQQNKNKQNNQQAQQQQVNNQPQPRKGSGGCYNDVNWNSNGPYGVNARTYYSGGRIHSTDPWIDSQYVENINNGNWNPDGTDTVQGYINEYHQEPGRGSDDVCPN